MPAPARTRTRCAIDIERTQDVKKYLAIGIMAVLGGAALPAGAVTQSGTVTVKWNTAVAATIALATNYDATGAQQLTAPSILTAANGGSGACTATGAGSEAAGTVNFGSITPDFAQTTGCLYKNAVNALVKTNSTSWSVAEKMDGLPTGSTLCALGNGIAFPAATLTSAPATQSGRAAAVAGTTCSGGPSITTASTTVVSSATAYPSGANIGEDLQLLLSTAAATGAQTQVLTVTVTAN